MRIGRGQGFMGDGRTIKFPGMVVEEAENSLILISFPSTHGSFSFHSSLERRVLSMGIQPGKRTDGRGREKTTKMMTSLALCHNQSNTALFRVPGISVNVLNLLDHYGTQSL
jgi:hypothetical protein